MKFKLFIASCFALQVLSAFAQQGAVKSLTLPQAIELAKKNNYALLNSRIDQQISEKKASEILASGLPQINAAGNFTNNIQIPTQSLPNFLKETFVGSARGQAEAAARQQNPNATPDQVAAAGNAAAAAVSAQVPDYLAAQFGNAYALSGSVTASQLIFDGTYFLGVKAAKEYVNLARLGAKRTEVEIEAGVTKIYYAALLTQANMNMLDNNINTLEKTLNYNRAYYKNGLVEKLDLDRLELSYSTTKIQRDKTYDQYVISLMTLKLQLGIPVLDSVVLADDLEKLYGAGLTPVDAKPDYSKRPEYQFVQQQIRLQDYDRKRYNYGYVPTLNAFITHQENTFAPSGQFNTLGTTWYPGTILGVNLNVPIFDGFRKSAQIQQSKLTRMKYENDRKNLENNIENEVQQARLRYDRARQQLDIQKRNMELSQEIYNRANIKFKNGVGSTLELTTAENDMKTAQASYLGSLYDLLVSQVDLRKSLGLLN